MKNNKGYYSWIHSLKSAAMDSHKKGIELNEARKGPARGVSNYLPGQIERKTTDTRAETAAAGIGKVLTAMGDTKEDIIRQAPEIIALGQLAVERPGSVAPSEPSEDVGDVGPVSTDQVRQAMSDATRVKMKTATAAANAARGKGPVNMKPAGNANMVEVDAQDGEMADPEAFTVPSARHIPDQPPADREFPAPQFNTPAEAEAYVRAMNAMKFAKENPMSGEEVAAAERAAEEKEEYELSHPSAAWRTVREAVNDKINSMLQENEANDAPRKQSDKPRERKAKKPGKIESARMPGNMPGEGRTVGRGGVNFKALLDVYNNPEKYPPNISQAVQASFKDIFERGLGLPNS